MRCAGSSWTRTRGSCRPSRSSGTTPRCFRPRSRPAPTRSFATAFRRTRSPCAWRPFCAGRTGTCTCTRPHACPARWKSRRTSPAASTPGALFAACYADLDHFKEFNDRYSYHEGDRVIRILAQILHDVVKGQCHEQGFVGHIGGDDFIFIVPLPDVNVVCEEIVSIFDTLIPYQYSEQDRRAGYFFGKDRRGQLHRVPLMTVSIGVVTNERRRFGHAAQVSSLATEMKSYAKTLPGSVYSIDRRTDAVTERPGEPERALSHGGVAGGRVEKQREALDPKPEGKRSSERFVSGMQLGVPRRSGEGPVGRRPRALLRVRRRHHRRGGRSDRGRVRALAGCDTHVAARSGRSPSRRVPCRRRHRHPLLRPRSAKAGAHANARGTAARYRDSGAGATGRRDTVSDARFAAGDARRPRASARGKPAAASDSRRTGRVRADSVGPVFAAGRFRGARTGDPAGIIGTASDATAVRGTGGHSAPASGASAVRLDARASGGRARWRAASRGETRAEHAGATRDADHPGPTGDARGARAERGGWRVAVDADARADQSVSRQRPEREGSAAGARARVRSGDVLSAAARRRPSRRNAARALSRRDQEVSGRVRRAGRPRLRGIDDALSGRVERHSRRRTADLLRRRTCADREVALGCQGVRDHVRAVRRDRGTARLIPGRTTDGRKRASTPAPAIRRATGGAAEVPLTSTQSARCFARSRSGWRRRASGTTSRRHRPRCNR